MTFFEQFFSNTIFLTAAFGWLVAQILKTLIHLIVSKKFVAERLVGSGGMPSSHSATVCALVTAVCYEYGAGSFEFAISLILAIIVMYDKLKEFVGHTPLQVLMGALLGILCGVVIYSFLL